jgi:hypothetical protein
MGGTEMIEEGEEMGADK